jgi:hypothetical protein
MTERPLNENLQWCVASFVSRASQWLGVEAESDTPDLRQERLRAAINTFRSSPADIRESRLDVESHRIGCVWGQAVCDQLGWEWATLSPEPGVEELAVVSPSRAHAVFPVLFIHKLLTDIGRDPTSLLVYNMLKAGSLPPAAPGEYCILG